MDSSTHQQTYAYYKKKKKKVRIICLSKKDTVHIVRPKPETDVHDTAPSKVGGVWRKRKMQKNVKRVVTIDA